MPRSILRVTKWLSVTPAVAVCTSCGKEFKVPMNALMRTKDAQANLQSQFAGHQCRQSANPEEKPRVKES